MKKILVAIFPFLDNTVYRKTWIIKQLSKIPNGETILDAGAGECQYKPFASHLKYVSQDFSQYDGTGDNVGLQTKKWDTRQIDIVSDIIAMPVDSNSYDNILCAEVLEHIPYPDMAIKEFMRVLKPNGRLILTAPFASYTHFAPYHFCTGFNSYWYKTILNKYDFEIISIEANGNYFDVVCQEMVRVPLIFRQYTSLSYLSFILYIPIVPIVIVLSTLNNFKNSSSEFCNFGYHIIAKKK